MLSFRRANILDFAQAYKAFYYVAPLTLFVGKNIFRDKEIIKLLNILLTLFLLKYGYSRALNLTERMGERPGIFVENNFELIFLLIIFYITESKFTAKDRLLRTLAVVAIVFLSGSRSALLALIAMFLFMHIKKLNGKTIISLLTLGLLIAGTSYIFITRMDGDIQTIDRFRFLQIFLDETKNWEWYEYILGTLPLTPLSDYSCKALSAYSALYSYSGDDSCYSVILHSFILRVIFDHGIAGLLFIIAFVLQALKRSGHTPRQRLCIISIILISAASVSAFNSVFTALALAIAFSQQKTHQTNDQNQDIT